jgi:hypothetical protein
MKRSSVKEIVGAIEKLSPEEFVKLQARIDRISEKLWQNEHQRLSRTFREEGLSDEDIDRLILRRRYRGRAQ